MNPLLARKRLFIIDDEIVFMGGINISSVHSGSSLIKPRKPPEESALAWRDTDIK